MHFSIFESNEIEIGSINKSFKTDALAIIEYFCKIAKLRVRKRNRWNELDKSIKQNIKLSEISKEYIPFVKPLKLSDTRVKQLEVAMRETKDCPYSTINDLKEVIFKTAEDIYVHNFDANTYYHEKVAAKYDHINNIKQKRLTNRSLDLMIGGNMDENNTNNNELLILDLASGSGISSRTILERFRSNLLYTFVIGADLSKAMLNIASSKNIHGEYLDFVSFDMKQPSPFRSNVFDSTVSISAIHYLSHSEKYLKVCFNEIKRITKKKVVMQFFPPDQADHSSRILYCSKIYWKNSFLFLDQTQSTPAYRWYLLTGKSDQDKRFNNFFNSIHSVCKMFPCATINVCCILCIPSAKKIIPYEHYSFLILEHCRFVRQLLRNYRHDPNSSSNFSLNISKILNLNLDSLCSIPSMDNLISIYWKQLHLVLHPSTKEFFF